MEKIITADKEISSIPGYNSLTDNEKELIDKYSNRVSYNNGDVIIKQNTRTSHIMYIKSGLVKVYKEGRNNKVINLKIALPGSYVGLLSVFGDDIYQYNASSIQNAEILFIDVAVFRDIINQNGTFSAHLIKQISVEGLFVLDKLMNLYHKQLPGRIADVLLFFSEKIFQSNTFDLPLTRRELAEFAGTTKESFIRTLTEFRNDRIINLERKRVDIISMDILKTLSRLG
jgi:CRP/FNR family transcriptional regulator, polysaccharide utilization system transcription regulator